VILHCFAVPDRLDEAIANGWWCSFAGNVTYPKAADLLLAAARCPADRLLLETDAPYLTPVPHRGTPNEPAYVMDTLRAVALVRGVAPEELAAQVEANADAAYAIAG
jgi:TatD DNase family protein